MKHNKLLHLVVMSFFLMQTVLPSMAGAAAVTASRKPVDLSAKKLFDDSVTQPYRDLISAYLNYVAGEIPVRKSLFEDSEAINRLLSEISPWKSFSISDPVFSSLLSESESGVAYITRESIPVEARLIAQIGPLEKTMAENVAALARDQKVPDTMMQTARSLQALYGLYDQVWDMKSRLLLKILGLRRNIDINYLKTGASIDAAARSRAEDGIRKLEQLESTAGRHFQQLLDLKKEYEQAEAAFNRIAVNTLQMEKDRTSRLRLEIRKMIADLNKSGGENEKRHGELLENIDGVLKYRLDLIQQRLAALQAGVETGNTFLYLPESTGTDSQVSAIGASLRETLGLFVEQTGKRLNLAVQLKEEIQDVTQRIDEEHALFSTVIADANGIKQEEADRVDLRMQALTNDLKAGLATQGAAIASAIEEAGNVDYADPEKVLSDPAASARLVHANSVLEALSAGSRNLDVQFFAFGFQMAQLLQKVYQETPSGDAALSRLEQANLDRSSAVESYLNTLDSLGNGFAEDQALSIRLRTQGARVIKTGSSMFLDRLNELDTALTKEKQYEGTPYYDYLAGVRQMLSDRRQLISAIDSGIPSRITDTSCPSCSSGQALWSELAAMGSPFTSALSQLEGLSGMGRLFSSNAIQADTPFEYAKNLFALSDILQNPPLLALNDDSIDVIFRANDRVVVVKGIGDVGKLSLASWNSGNDPFLSTPYIGSSRALRQIWNSASSAASTLYSTGAQALQTGQQIVTSVGTGIVGTGSQVIQTVGTYGGQFITAAGQTAAGALQTVGSALQTVGQTAISGLKLTGNFLSNYANNALFDSDGSIGWLKVGGYILAGAACGVTGGIACAPLAVALVADALKGGIDTAAMPQYDLISKNSAEWAKLGVDVVALVAGFKLNYAAAMEAGQWASMSNLGRLATLFGLNPNNLQNIGNLRTLFNSSTWDKIVDALDAGRNILAVPDNLFQMFSTLWQQVWGTGGSSAPAVTGTPSGTILPGAAQPAGQTASGTVLPSPAQQTVTPQAAPVQQTVTPQTTPTLQTITPQAAPGQQTIAPQATPTQQTIAPQSTPAQQSTTPQAVPTPQPARIAPSPVFNN